ncbi:MAG: HNH endonuclease [Bdellovibrionales bacterium]|nr:HNH endonuclease [Oligoflexia bacterium]
MPDPSFAKVFEVLLDLAVKNKICETKRSSAALPSKAGSPNSLSTSKVEIEPNLDLAPKLEMNPRSSKATKPENLRFIPSALKRFLWRRDGGFCAYQNPISGKKCGSSYQIQFDHIQPVAKGGLSCADNLRLLCRGHNLLSAREQFGRHYMEKFGRTKTKGDRISLH